MQNDTFFRGKDEIKNYYAALKRVVYSLMVLTGFLVATGYTLLVVWFVI